MRGLWYCPGVLSAGQEVNCITKCTKRKPKELILILPQSECLLMLGHGEKRKGGRGEEGGKDGALPKENKSVHVNIIPGFLQALQVMICLPEARAASCHFIHTALSLCKDRRIKG